MRNKPQQQKEEEERTDINRYEEAAKIQKENNKPARPAQVDNSEALSESE